MTNQNARSDKDAFKEQFAKRIKHFVLNLVHFIDGLTNERTTRIIGDQLMRSGTSIGANYFEAKAASSRNDFTNFFRHSLKSANETKFWLETLIESEKCNGVEASNLLDEVGQLANIFASSILTLKGRK